jgi:hypothetical protein
MLGLGGENKIFCTYLLPPKNPYNKCNKTTKAPKTLVAKKIDLVKSSRLLQILLHFRLLQICEANEHLMSELIKNIIMQ